VIAPLPVAVLTATVVICGSAWAHGYMTGRNSRAEELARLVAAGEAQTAAARRTTEEVANVQKLYVDAWTRARDAARREWLRARQDAAAGGVPEICAKPASSGEPASGPVATPGPPPGADALLPAVINALEAGDALEARLSLCQSELRQCAAMR
jgi:hypothetical protein